MESKSTLSTSVVRRKRLTAVSARMASQPYPAIAQRSQEYPPSAQRTQAWVEGLENVPHVEASATPQENITRVLPGRWDYEGYGEQSALAEALLFPDYSLSTRDVLMKDAWESTTVASTMHTASMLDWNDAMSEATIRPSKKVRRDISPLGENEGDCDDEGSVYAPSSRSVTPPRRVSPRKVKNRKPRRATLDENYDEENIEPAISGEAPVGEDTLADERRRYLPSSTAVEDNSATSSPRGSPPPPPPPRRKGTLRGKVARRASWKPRVNLGSHGDNSSGSA